MKSCLARSVALVCAVVSTVAGSLPLLLADGLAARSGAGGTVWCRYDAHGHLVERQFDTNGDGRPDVAEYYGHGALLRRASDRNFNGVTDLVEDFDAVTQKPVRSIVDQDYDGTADLLVLFRNGDPVVSERAPADREAASRTATVGGSSTAGLVALKNPFGADAALESPVGASPQEPWMAGARADALLFSFTSVSVPFAVAAFLPRVDRATLTADFSLPSPRGPPQA
ncbi:MAG TPA: hypothetical protein VH138_17935 [Vicinamibacterales bacterium]|jgi:hypothetical protein|nr:hypothetical protein [Vicinamibacterales bacterium]